MGNLTTKDIPWNDKFKNKYYKTKIRPYSVVFDKEITRLLETNEVADFDIIYENLKPIFVFTFNTEEDCLAFTLKYGDKY